MKIEKDLKIIATNAEQRYDKNMKFRTYLKNKNIELEKMDKIVHEIYKNVISQIDCTECANCCIELRTSLYKEELEKILNSLQLDFHNFVSQHADLDSEEDKYNLKNTPCYFLNDKKCSVYKLRPEECKTYPHLDKDRFVFRLFGVVDNYAICPIVYNVYEQLKQRFNFR
jgi:uncharacterized protein